MLTTYSRILDNTRCKCDPEQPTWPGTDKCPACHAAETRKLKLTLANALGVRPKEAK